MKKQLELDGTAPYVRESKTSFEAADSMKPHLGALQVAVLSAIRAKGHRGATCDELELEMGLRHQTLSARVRELAQKGLIKTDETRKTRSGRQAQAWKVA